MSLRHTLVAVEHQKYWGFRKHYCYYKGILLWCCGVKKKLKEHLTTEKDKTNESVTQVENVSQTLKRSNERLKSSVLKAVSDGIVWDSESSTLGNFFCQNNVCWCVLGKNVLQSWLSLGISDIALTPFLTLLSS